MTKDRFIPPKGAFTCSVKIRFSHCDMAGIVYYPNYFTMLDGVIIDWYSEELDIDYHRMIIDTKCGLPFVHVDADFISVSRMGELIDFTLLVERIGRSSLSLLIVGHCNGLELLRVRLVNSLMSLEEGCSIPWSQDIRDKLELYQARCSVSS